MKLNTKKTIFVGLAFLIICMFWQVYDNIVAKMLINTFGLNQTWSGAILALDNIFALFLLPIFGILSDKIKYDMAPLCTKRNKQQISRSDIKYIQETLKQNGALY